MLATLLVGSALTLAGPPVVESPAPDLTAYETARAGVGRDPDDHVRLALWCEAHGLKAEGLKHLAIAVIANPRHSMARGLMGLVEYRGRWQRPEAINENARTDALLAEYRDRRQKAKDDADSQWALARWCDEQNLKEEAVAHYTAVIKRDPKRDAAWRRLGFKKQGQRWVTDAQLAAEKAEGTLQKQADREWKPKLEKWRDGLSSKSARRRAEAETALAEITDPRAVPMVGACFTDTPARQMMAVRIFGQIEAVEASKSLAALAAFGDSAEVRRAATETLRRRDPREFADLLIALLRDPIKYKVKPVGGPGSPGELFIENKQANVSRRYSPPSGPTFNQQPGDQIIYDAQGLPVLLQGNGAGAQPLSVSARDLFPGGYPIAGGRGVPQTAFNNQPTSHNNRHIVTPQKQPQLQNLINQLATTAMGTAQAQEFVRLAREFDNPQQAFLRSLTGADPLHQMAGASLLLNPGTPLTQFSFQVLPITAIPVGQMELEAQKTAMYAQDQLEKDVESLKQYNEPINKLNAQILPILKEVAGQDVGDSQESWTRWWVDQIGYTLMPQKASPEPTTIIEDVPLNYQPPPLAASQFLTPVSFTRMSCFGAGTPVHTLSGVQPIESLKEGDRVLTQDTRTGSLNYKPILVVHRNPPSPTYRITLGEEVVISSYFHRFWKVGHGWVMARDLVTGDTIRTLGGITKVQSIDKSEVQPVFNLDVAEDADFFVGRQGALVHDNTLPDLKQTPFDAPNSLATARATSPNAE